MVAATVVVLLTLPVLLLGAAFAVRWLPGRWRGLRLLWFLLVYLVRETVGLIALFLLWVLSGFGWKLHSERFQRAHVVLIGWFLRGLTGTGRRILGLRIVTEELPGELAVPNPFHPGSEDGCRPVLVFSRHAGAGDSFILVDLLVNTYGRRPHIVLKDLLQLDPCIDVALNRIPNRFISPNPTPGAGVTEAIAELAGHLEGDGALILFPEGGNFTERRRRHSIEKLRTTGLEELVPRAVELTHLLPPRPGGAFAAIDAAPDAEILFVAHTGLEQLSTVGDIWRGLPMRSEVHMAWWAVHPEDVPVVHEDRVIWLYDWWERIDTWIEDHHVAEVPAGPKLG